MLDCSGGIDARAIVLALYGHQAHATDLSPVSVDCARREATDFGVSMNFCVADFRKLGAAISDAFHVVISCDNAIAHCLEDDDLAAARGAGYEDIRWHVSETSGYHQPIMTARNR